MASNSVAGVSLLLIAVLFYSTGYAWMALGALMIGGVMVFSGGSKKVPMPPKLEHPTQATQAAEVAKKKKPKLDPYWMSQNEWNEKFSNVDSLKFRPSIPPDGIAGVKAYGGKEVSLGGRTGQLSIYTGKIRFKNDLRFMPQFCYDEGSKTLFKNLVTSHFRTQEPVFLEKVKPLDSTFEGLDKQIWDDQGWFD